jgi:hypothetical protein
MLRSNIETEKASPNPAEKDWKKPSAFNAYTQ